MFSYTGLSTFEVKVLRERFHIYLLNSGRISISGRKPPKPLFAYFVILIYYSKQEECAVRCKGDS